MTILHNRSCCLRHLPSTRRCCLGPSFVTPPFCRVAFADRDSRHAASLHKQTPPRGSLLLKIVLTTERLSLLHCRPLLGPDRSTIDRSNTPMEYKIIAKIIQPTAIDVKGSSTTPEGRERDEAASERNADVQDYVSITLEWGNDRKATATTSGAKFRQIVNACAPIWQQHDRSEERLKTAGERIADLLRGESYDPSNPDTESVRDSIRGFTPSSKKPYEILGERLQLPDKLDHIMIVTNDDTLEELPWELLVIDERFVSLLEDVRIFRLRTPTADTKGPEGTIDLRIMNVNMSNTSLAFGSEPCAQLSAQDPPSELLVCSLDGTNITPSAIQKAVVDNRPFTVFHFAGHGDLIEGERPALCLSSDRTLKGMSEYQATLMEPLDLAAFLRSNNDFHMDTALVVCACCQSGIGRNSTGFGIQLIDKGVSAVVGMQAPIHDLSANHFTQALYERLDDSNDIVSAVAGARRSVARLGESKHSLDWWIPTLHAVRRGLVFEHKRGKYRRKRRSSNLQTGQLLREQGNYEAALDVLNEVASTQRRRDSLKTLSAISMSYRDIGELEQSLQIDQQLLEQQLQMFSEFDPNTLMTRRRMAITLTDLGTEPNYRKALAEERTILRGQEAAPDTPKADLLRTRKNVATLYGALGELSAALEMEMLLLQESEIALGPEHRDTLRSRNNIADLNRRLGNSRKAVEMERELLRDRERILGHDHPDTLTSRNNIGLSLSKLGQYADSLEMEKMLLKDRERILGPDHPDTLTSRHVLAVALWEVGKYRECMMLEEQVLAERRQFLPEDDPETLKTMHNLADSWRHFGRLHDALELQHGVLAIRERVLGPRHRDTLVTRHDIAVTLREMGSLDAALELHEEVLLRSQLLSDEDMENKFIYMDDMAVTLRMMGRFEEALEIHRQVLEDRSHFLGSEHPGLLDTPHEMAIVLREMGRLIQARNIHQDVRMRRQQSLGVDHPKTLLSQYELAITLSKMGRLPEALRLLSDALQRQESILGKSHPHTVRCHLQVQLMRSRFVDPSDTD